MSILMEDPKGSYYASMSREQLQRTLKDKDAEIQALNQEVKEYYLKLDTARIELGNMKAENARLSALVAAYQGENLPDTKQEDFRKRLNDVPQPFAKRKEAK